MRHSWATGYLLAYPIGLMGLTQMVFAILSLSVFRDHDETQFFWPALAQLAIAVMFMRVARGFDFSAVSFRGALLYAVVTWSVMGVFGAIPIASITGVSFVDAVFESVSALTTTGATVLSGLDGLPASFLLYRQFLQWLGGLGVVIFVVAVMPMLNVGGLRLLKAETPGPIKDDKVAPRVASSAHYLWLVYISLTCACAVGYWCAGMTVFDAVAHSFSTVSTGGFSTRDASLGHYHSSAILWVANAFMALGAISFALHFRAVQQRRLRLYWHDEETRVFLLTIAVLSAVAAVILYRAGLAPSWTDALQLGVFHIISFITSTGFAAGDYSSWGDAMLLLLLGTGYLGGCAGSTAGGNKFVRNILFWRLVRAELESLIHPRALIIVKYQGKHVEDSVLRATMGFMALVVVSTLVISFALTLTGLDLKTALTATGACLNVLGPAFGSFGSNFSSASDGATTIMTAAMIIGRLEYFTVLALFVPSFWRY